MIPVNWKLQCEKWHLCLLLIMCLYAYPIISLERFYIDDLGRSLYGYTGWGANARPLSDWLMSSLNFGGALLDLSPLYQLLSLAVLLLCLVAYVHRLNNKISSAAKVISCFLFIASPFYIENLSYRYDSLPMAFSIAAVIIPFCLSPRQRGQNVICVLLIIISLCFYQAAIGLFAILSVMEIIFKYRFSGNKCTGMQIIKRLLQFGVAVIIYQCVISHSFSAGSYTLTHAETLTLSKASVTQWRHNIEGFLWYFSALVASMPKPLTGVYGIIFTASLLFLSGDLYKKGGRKNSLSLIVLLLSPFLVLMFSIITLTVLKQPIFAPRVLISFGGVMLYFSLITFMVIRNKVAQIIISLPVIWLVLFYAYAYSSSSKSQQDTDSVIANSIYNNVSASIGKLKYVSISGIMPRSQQLLLAINKLPIMERLVPLYINNDWSWGAIFLNHHGFNLQGKIVSPQDKKALCSQPPVFQNSDYKLYISNDTLFLFFEGVPC